MVEQLAPDDVQIALVSGFGNTDKSVEIPHEGMAANLRGRGFTVVTIHPDYVNESFDEALDRIGEVRADAEKAGKRFMSMGTSAGGTVSTAERMRYALANGVSLEELGGVPLDYKGVVVCSRSDFSQPGANYPSEKAIRGSSGLLESATEYVSGSLAVVVFNAENTLCLTAGQNDERVPHPSSVLPHAREELIANPGFSRFGHHSAVYRVLSDYSYREMIADFAVGKAA